MFNMMSLGVHIDESVNNGRGPYVFKISDQLYHWLGSLSPAEGDPPRFSQLYIYDTDNEVDNCRSHFGGENSHLCRDIFEGFIDMLDTPNALVQLFRTAREKLADTYVPNFKVRLYNVVGVREYELPTGDMLGAIVYEPGPETDMDYDIIIEERSGHPQRVNKLHSSYMSLQFPLLFPYGEDGYSKDLKLLGGTGTSESDKWLTMKAYYVEPVVQILSIHLQNMQRVVFRDRDRLDSVVVNANSKKTTLTEWLYYNEWNTNGRHLMYLDFPSEFVWNPSGKYWRRRRLRHKSSIGRLTYVHPSEAPKRLKGCRSRLETR
ncbi:hypothetical protein Tco_1091483 [Tanacetum coccineum]|uniref:Helitron helicase-like domain-containing protein n=1 Tax=Tanacetum coccineum TaxID=301880 RepID=A0ABQ5I7C0_9ASTR